MRELVPPLSRCRPPAGVLVGALAIAALVSPLAGTVLAQSYPRQADPADRSGGAGRPDRCSGAALVAEFCPSLASPW